jgi:4-amino-4-deoxy-L-arabinose transferase-like glycosyltransferase
MLVIITFLLFSLLITTYFKKNTKELFLVSVLLFSAFIVFSTEVLSFFHSLNFITLLSFWILFNFSLFCFCFKNRKVLILNFRERKNTLITNYKTLKKQEKILLLFVLLFLTLILFQGLIYPTNNWDSLTYHMSRIMYWIGNESVNHFPTHILRELYQPPFTEYFILHTNIINGNDYLSNTTQWLFLIFSMVAIWLLLDFFKISRFYKLLGVFLLITTPSIELQASTTKNDIVCGFFILSTLYFALKTYYDSGLKYFILLGISVGLGLLTKGTSYLFIFPILLLLFCFILFKIIQTKQNILFLYGVFAIIIVLLLNIGHYYRNYQVNGNVLNIDETEAKMYSNEKMNVAFLASNVIKNIGLHLGYPVYEESDFLIKKFHNNFKIDINNPETNYSGMNYQVSQELITHEDGACNTTHFLLTFVATLFLLSNAITNYKKNYKTILLLLIILFQIILFSGFLKWQPWHSRLHIPIFMLSVILIIIASQKARIFRFILFVSLPVLIFSFGFFILYNNIRPLLNDARLTKTITVSDSRFKKYFANQPALYEDYSEVLNSIYKNNPRKIGLMISDWEYPLFNQCYYDKIHIQSINVGNITNKINQDTKNIEAIICNNRNEAVILFNGHKYINQTPENEYIWFYK